MNVNEVLDRLRDSGMTPIVVNAAPDSDSDIRPTGTLQDYLEALKVLGVSSVLIETFQLADDDFYYDDDEGEEDGSTDRRDLRVIDKKLRSYEHHIGEIGRVKLWAPTTHGDFVHDVLDDWWVPLFELVDAAQDSVASEIHEESERREAEGEAEEEAQRKELRAQLGKLVNDTSFQKLKTQRAMREYALEQYPDLVEWDPAVLRDEIQALAARVEVLRTKKR